MMAKVSWLIDVVNAKKSPLQVAQEAAKHLEQYLFEQMFEVVDSEGNRFYVDLENGSVKSCGTPLATGAEPRGATR